MKPHVLMIGTATPRMIGRLEASCIVHKAWELDDLDAFLSRNGGEIAGVSIYGASRIDAALIDRLPNLKIISNYGVGYDAIDVAHAVKKGIVVTHTPNVLNRDVANTAIMLMLAVSRCLIRDERWLRSGDWKAKGSPPLTRSIEGKRVGILGLGRIGETLAGKLVAAFACDIAYHARHLRDDIAWRYFPDLVEMAGNVDYLVVITPGGSATRHLVNRAVIEALGPEGTLINIARGSVVDEKEMVAALVDGRLGSAGLDVFENEPEVPQALLTMDNVVLTPHVGSATVETRRAMGDLVVENLIRYFADGTVATPVPECRHYARIAPADRAE